MTDAIADTQDSVAMVLKNAGNDSTRCMILYDAIVDEDVDSVWQGYNDQLHVIAKKNYAKYPKGHKLHKSFGFYYAHSLNYKGIIHKNKGELFIALENYTAALQVWTEIDDKDNIARLYNNMGTAHLVMGDVTTSLDYLGKSLKIYEEMGNKAQKGICLNNIGYLYTMQKEYDIAREYYDKALKIALDKNDKQDEARIYNNIGDIYRQQEQYEEALKYALKALALREKLPNKRETAVSLANVGFLYKNTGDLAKAMSYTSSALELQQEMEDNQGVANSLNNIGDAYFRQKKYGQAIEYSSRSLALSQKIGFPVEIRRAAETLSNIYRATNNPAKALEAYELFVQMRDSVNNQSTQKESLKAQFKYEFEKKEKETQLLQQQNELSKLKLESRNRMILAVIILLLLLIALGLWLYNRSNLKKKQHELLMLQNLQKDKERIARDLHDNVGGQLSYVIYSLDGITDEDKEKSGEVKESINQSVRSVIGSLRETIWAISDASINAQDFSDKLKVFAKTLFKHTDTQIRFTENLQSAERELNALLGLNLYRICQEILNNAFKYAKAEEVRIDVQEDDEKLLITIGDNGIGFDTSKNCKEQYGLQNIRKRAMEFGVSLTLKTEIDKGTKYELSV